MSNDVPLRAKWFAGLWLLTDFAIFIVLAVYATINNGVSLFVVVLLVVCYLWACFLAAYWGAKLERQNAERVRGNREVQSLSVDEDEEQEQEQEEAEETSLIDSVLTDYSTLTDGERRERVDKLVQEREKLQSQKIEDELRKALLTQYWGDARLAVRRDELHNRGQHASHLSGAVRRAAVQRDEQQILIDRKQIRIRRLDCDIKSLERLISNDRAAAT